MFTSVHLGAFRAIIFKQLRLLDKSGKLNDDGSQFKNTYCHFKELIYSGLTTTQRQGRSLFQIPCYNALAIL